MLSSLALTIVLMSPQHKPANADTAAVRNLYPRIDRVFEQKDWRAVSSMMASDYVEDTADHHKINKKTFLEQHKKAFAPLYDIKADVKPIDVSVTGKTATVESRYVMSAKFKDEKGVHKMRSEGSEVHRWRKEHGSWVLGYLKEHESSTSVDGKVVQHAP